MDNTESTVKFKRILRDNISRFCAAKSPKWSRPVHRVFDILQRHKLHAVVFGGTNRTLIARNFLHLDDAESNRPRDIDIVVDGVDTDDLYRIFRETVKRKTRFGGLQLFLDGISFDIWPLQTTWMFTVVDLERSFASLPRTTFLNVEAIAIDVWPMGRGRSVYSWDGQFFKGLLSETLELNNAANPYPALCIVRALHMAVKMKFGIGAELAGYLMENINGVTDDSLSDAQVSHYGKILYTSSSIRKAIDIIHEEKASMGCDRFLPKLGQLPLWS